jgi:hypothetical protein
MGIVALVAACAVAIWLAGRTVGNAGSNSPIAPTPTPGIAVARPTLEPPEMVAAAERRPLPATGGKPIAVHDYLGRRVVLAFYAEST